MSERARGWAASYDREQRYCNLCPRMCRHTCPVENADRDESVTPQEKNTAARMLRLAARPADEDHVSRLYKCSGCRLCQTHCEHDNDVAASLFAARALAVDSGVVLPEVAAFGERYARHDNPFGEDLRPRLAAVDAARRVGEDGPVRGDLGRVPTVPGRGLRVYWPGCATLHHQPELVGRTLAVFDRLGEADRVVYCGAEQCCGYPLLAAGYLDRFETTARRVAGVLDGAAEVHTGAPECAWTFLEAYPERAGVTLEAEVGPVVDVLARALEHAPQGPPVDLDTAWHDPCYLGRHLGRYEAPRKVLNGVLAAPPAEPLPWTKELGYCSGGGGLLPETSPQTADAITETRVADLTGTTTGPPAPGPAGQRRIVTACPTCTGRFRAAGAKASDVVEILAAYLGLVDDLDGGAS